MTTDGFDDVRLLLHDAHPGPLPDLDVESILREGARLRRRTTRDRWLAVAAAVLVVAGAGVAVAQISRPAPVGPSDPSTPSAGFAPKPFSPETWLLYSQTGIDAASSVHFVGELGTSPDGVTMSVDAVLGQRSAQGSLDAEGVTSRYLTTADGVTYVEPAALVKAGVITAGDAGSASWVRLSPPSQSRFRAPGSVRGAVNVADFYRWDPGYAEPRVIGGRATVAISIDASQIAPRAKTQTFFFDEQAPYLPLLIERDGRQIATFSDWNAPVTTPVAPPASDVVDIPGL